MPLTVGSRVGPYEVTGALGAGGMGEVWRARDPRLGRDVAIKGLPEAFGRDLERRARFDREARLLASLNHPNIAAIYGLEEALGTPYLVLELVDGESLAQLLARGPLTARETLDVGQQIAAAIEAAHDKGVIHRDLKPGNVMRTPAGTVKVLDFGLARGGALESGVSSELSAPATMAVSATGVGVVLGTAPYMSPEQARGQAVDRRTDVWAFGCILYECLAGHAAFAGETASDILARVLEREPAWDALPQAAPLRLRDLVRRCLTKDAAERPRDIGDLRRELGAILADLSGVRPGAAGGAGASDVPSLAVLYFENLARDPESDYFCAGITEDILTDLSKIKGLRVASRNAVARFRGQAADLAEVGRALGVRHVLEGSVRRAGDRLRITAQLVNAADGFHLWAERYDRTMQDVFAVQEEIASSIAQALSVALSPSEVRALAGNRPDDARAYDLYLKGRAEYGQYSLASLRAALNLFHQAIAIDADYALAWSGVADSYGQLLQYGLADEEESRRLGFEAADRALAIDPQLPEAHKARSLLLRMSGRRDEGRRELERAVELNPRYTSALMNLSVDDFDEANVAGCLRRLLRVLVLDPQEQFALTWAGWLYAQMGAREEAQAMVRRLRALAQTPFYRTAVYALQAGLLMEEGRYADAEATLREGMAAGANPPDMRLAEARILAHTGRDAEARARVVELVDTPGLTSGSLTDAAATAARVGELALGVRYLTRPGVVDLSHTLVRLIPDLHPYAGMRPFAPRKRDATLVWPLEAPRLDAARFHLFREVRIESAEPPRSSVLDAAPPAE